MLLTSAELESLINLQGSSPHALLGVHPLGTRTGLVGRACLPGAQKVRVIPLHGTAQSGFDLQRISDTNLFEGVVGGESSVCTYDLDITWADGSISRGRDPYSFWPTVGETDLHLFGEGNHRKIFDVLGSHLISLDGASGVSFAVWAPSARRVSVVGTFNQWDGRRHWMRQLGASGVWEIFIPGVTEGALYKFEIQDANGTVKLNTDPFGQFFEQPPKQSAIVWNTRRHQWSDSDWVEKRSQANALKSPMSIYEFHLGSWKKSGPDASPGYRGLVGPLVDYLRQTGFTHVEMMPIAEHAYYPSWGYQVTGFYAPTSRYGTPDDFQYLVDALHEADIGVLIDWVPGHFPRDTWALARFDGTALFEHEDPKQGAHQDWGTLIFNYGRHEVRNFLAANALYWCDRYHVDGLRVDAVASMLYLDYSRKEGEWIPNQHGGRENLEAIEFFRHVNHLVGTDYPGVVTIAEESTSWPMVSRPPWIGGLGFTMKWNMGWMHDTLGYFKRDPIHRQFHQNDLTFAMLYHGHENFVLPLSHDEVVHGKGSLFGRMPGDDWQAFANLRCLLAYQWFFPGKKLLFMGCEIGQAREWNENGEVDWWLVEKNPSNRGIQRLVEDLNQIYRREPALWRSDYETDGFFWIDTSDTKNSVLSFVRHDRESGSLLLVILNLTPELHSCYRVGLPKLGYWTEIFNSDSGIYGGSNQGNRGGVQGHKLVSHQQAYSAEFVLPPLSVSAFRCQM